LASAILVNLLHAVLTQAYQIDHIVSGMAINLLALGGTNYLIRSSTRWSSEPLPVLEGWAYWPISIVAVAFLAVYLARTRGGLRLYAVGNDPDKARLAGIEPVRVRYLALVGTGVLTGLAGTALVSNAGGFVDGMTAGRGYIALAALILGAWRVLPTLLACTFFGILFALQIQLQGAGIAGIELPKEFWLALPYLATLAALAGLVGKGRAPAGLGKP
jgi:simple sugar transport system permease protein